LRLLFSRSDDGGQTFTPFTNVTESVEPGSTRLRGKGRWSVVKVMPGLETLVSVAVDIKPRRCPNPLFARRRGATALAILGSENFHVSSVDVRTIRFEGIKPKGRAKVRDVAAPFGEPKDDCADCDIRRGDGFPDLVLQFDQRQLARALGPVRHTECRLLRLTGNLKPEFGGTPIGGEDVVTIHKR
jgi:hypothetical protein